MRRNLGHSPDILDFFVNPDACDPHAFVKAFGNWLRTKEAMNDLSEYEAGLLSTPGEAFLQHIEKDLNSNKSYKMVVLLALLDFPPETTSWPIAEIAAKFKQHYLNHPEQLWDCTELAKSANPAEFAIAKVETLLKSMPLKYMSNKADDFFVLDLRTQRFELKPAMHEFWRSPQVRVMLQDRTLYALKRYFHRRDVDISNRVDAGNTPSPKPAAHRAPEAASPEILLFSFEDVERVAFSEALPVVANLAAGAPFAGFDIADLDWCRDCQWANVPKRLARKRRFIVRVAGDSMEPTLPMGSYAIFDYHRHPRREHDIVIANLAEFGASETTQTIKRLSQTASHWVFTADNPEYSPFEVSKSETSHPILGVFVALLPPTE
jgi:SOS-response transcriptional repressor LexA